MSSKWVRRGKNFRKRLMLFSIPPFVHEDASEKPFADNQTASHKKPTASRTVGFLQRIKAR
jgi:hypothetical protein